MIQVLEFQTLFPNEAKKAPSSYLFGIDKTKLLKLAGHFSRASLNQEYFLDNQRVLSDWFRKENNDFANNVYKQILSYERHNKVKVCILNIYSSLLLFDLVVRSDISKSPTFTEAEQEVNIFKLYLILNSTYANKDRMVYESTKLYNIECRMEIMYLANTIFDTDLLNYNKHKTIITQFIKAYLLLEFLSTDKNHQSLLSALYEYYKCQDWKDYLRRVVPLMFNTVKAKDLGYLAINIHDDESYDENNEFIKKFSIDTTDTIEDPIDFKTIRNRPMYEIGKGSYLVVSDLFLNEKIFKGLFYKLYELNNKSTSPDRVSDFKSFFSDIISEKLILYNILDKIFEGRYLKFRGADIKDHGINGEPDYYIRDRNKVYLFESKDILIPADIKTSGDFDKLRITFREKLYFTKDQKRHKIKAKAILQIISLAQRLLDNIDFVKIDSEIQHKTLKIYPILVLHDNLFNAAGLNRLINIWFQRELNKLKKKGYPTKGIRPITIIDIDTLIFNKEAIKAFKGPLSYFIDEYHCRYIKINIAKTHKIEDRDKIIEQGMMPFSYFLGNHNLIKKYWAIPNEFIDYGSELTKANH